MDEIEIPQYFLCPISLQIMKDPVTTVTGITYDRESIEQWLISSSSDETKGPTCPFTKQPLPPGSDLTPNHMLRKLIQGWCIVNANYGIDRIPTPKFPVHRSVVMKLIRDVHNVSLCDNALDRMIELANESGKNKISFAEAGVAKATLFVILRCFKEGTRSSPLIDKALRIAIFTWNPSIVLDETNFDLIQMIQSLMWVYKNSTSKNGVQTNALIVLKNVIEIATATLLEKVKPDFFREMVNVLRKDIISPQATRAVLKILIKTCPLGTNKIHIIESGAVFELVEIEWGDPETKTSELLFCLLAHLCSCADGRQQFLKHAGGVAVVAKRLLRVSATADEFAMSVIEAIARSAATREVLMEMLRVGAVAKLCMVLQADSANHLKKRARDILRLHTLVWSNSPCIQVYLLTRFNK